MDWEEPAPRRRRRWWAVAAAVVALLLVAVLVATIRSREGTPLAVGPTSGEAEARTGDDTAAFAQQRLPPVDVTTEQPGSGPLLPGVADGLTLVAADGRGLQLVDLTSGGFTRIQVRRPAPASLSETLFAIGDTIVVDADDDVVGLAPFTSRPTRLAADHRAIPSTGTDSLWVFDRQSPFVGGTATRIGVDGTVRGRVSVSAAAQPLTGSDTGLLVGAPGVVTHVTADGERRTVARGTALAADGERLAWLECADDTACAVVIGTLDAPAQVRRALDPTVLPAGYFGLLGLPLGAFSPDGRWLALPLYESRTSRRPDDVTVSVLETATGDEVFRAEGSAIASFATPLAWSPDSAWLLFMSGRQVRAWPAGSGRARVLDVDLRGVRALAVR